VINIGQAGARAADVLWLVEEMRRMRFAPALIVISVGINDTMAPDRQPSPRSIRNRPSRQDWQTRFFSFRWRRLQNQGRWPTWSTDRDCRTSVRPFRQTAEKFSVPMIDVSTLTTRGSPWARTAYTINRDGSIQWISMIETEVSRQCP